MNEQQIKDLMAKSYKQGYKEGQIDMANLMKEAFPSATNTILSSKM